MLELKEYVSSEIREIFDSKDNQSLNRKLERLGVKYDSIGNGKRKKYIIKEIPDEFKVFCMTELRMPANVDYNKFKYTVYHMLNEPDALWLPDEALKRLTVSDGHSMCRQTISKHKQYLERNELIYTDKNEFVYFFSSSHRQTKTDKKEYCKAWKEYFKATKNVKK